MRVQWLLDLLLLILFYCFHVVLRIGGGDRTSETPQRYLTPDKKTEFSMSSGRRGAKDTHIHDDCC